MPVVIQVCCKNLVMQNLVRHVDDDFFILIKEIPVHILMQTVEHGAICHAVSVDHGVRIFECLRIVILGKDCSGFVLIMFHTMVQIIAVICPALYDWIVDDGSRYFDPCLYIWIHVL